MLRSGYKSDQFSWDARKAKDNLLKHGISIEEAQTVIADGRALLINDPELKRQGPIHPVGFSFKLRISVICHCCRDDKDVIRFLSARKATTREAQIYIQR